MMALVLVYLWTYSWCRHKTRRFFRPEIFGLVISSAEILAIRDDVLQHARLVRYYTYFGFKPVLEVENERLVDVPHLLAWGGPGTRMDADVVGMLTRWTPVLRRELARGANTEEEGST